MDEINAIYFTCPNCDSRELRHDADAEWDVENRAFTVKAIYDHVVCDTCGHETDNPNIKHVVAT